MSAYFLCLSLLVAAEMYPERADEAFAIYHALANENNT